MVSGTLINDRINIVPVKFSNNSFLKKIINELNRRFFSDISSISLDCDVGDAYSKDRAQFFSSQIIASFASLTTGVPGKILLLTEVDLFVPVLTFVFGEAQLNGKHSIVSVCRLHEEFYSGISDDELLFQRTMKEVLHELGHCYGLLHCIDWDCVMHSSQGIEEVDIKGSHYCKNCAHSIIGLKKN
jgi:archaemetzincin